MTTRAPSAANFIAIERPIPRPAPETRATLPARRLMQDSPGERPRVTADLLLAPPRLSTPDPEQVAPWITRAPGRRMATAAEGTAQSRHGPGYRRPRDLEAARSLAVERLSSLTTTRSLNLRSEEHTSELQSPVH